MYKYLLEKGGEINWMALFALFTFMFVFITAIILMLRRDKPFFNHMANLPIQEEESAPLN